MELDSVENVAVNEQLLKDSLEYAKGIQSIVIPSKEYVKEVFPDSFIFHQSKEAIGGDFYWVSQYPYTPHQHSRNPVKNIFALADCTGHGVPGALLSIAGYFMLNHVTREHKISNPANILTEMRKDMQLSFLENRKLKCADGMDIGILGFDVRKQQVLFSSARIPLYLFRNNEIIEYKGERESLDGMSTCLFSEHVIDVVKGDMFYLFTDGFPDQFGGRNNKKYLRKRLKSLLSEIHLLPIESQHEIIKEEFFAWKGDREQIDDVTVVGIKV